MDEGIGEASKYIAKIKMIDRAFGEDEAKRSELKELREYIDKALGEDAKRKELKEYIDGKIGNAPSNIAPPETRTGVHLQHISTVEDRAREIFSKKVGN